MNFVSEQFVLFLMAAWLIFAIVPAKVRWLVLLAASYVFYASWSLPFIAVILITTSIDYFCSKWIFESTSLKFRKSILFGAIFANLLVLGVFKYFNFFLDTQTTFAKMLGSTSPLPQHLEIILPLGISYYTFEAISYLIDVYRGMKPAPNWFIYNFYIMYFPHLICGPIIRFDLMWAQYKGSIRLPSWERFAQGFELIVLGYAFKTIIANNCALVADPVFANPKAASALMAYVAAMAFTAQLYFDFLGYTHIARGVSLLFNIELPKNFAHPANAGNYSEFWQRWQITLSQWLHDYLFRPLGGARKSLPRTSLNIFITFLVAGIWHGAGWTYVVLGTFFGAVVSGYHIFRRFRKKLLGPNERKIIATPVYNFSSHVLTFALMVVSAILFRATTVQDDIVVLGKLFRFKQLWSDLKNCVDVGDYAPIAIFLVTLALLHSGPLAVRLYNRMFVPMPYWLRLQASATTVAVCWIFCSAPIPQFIYFQF